MGALCVVPTYMRGLEEADVTARTLRTLREHEPDVAVLVVDDCSPSDEAREGVGVVCQELGIGFEECETNEGFSATVNVGIEEARDNGHDAILVNADIEFIMPFVDSFTETLDSEDRPAAVVGALLLYPSGLIQHGGIYFAFYERSFDHRYRYGPAGLPEAHKPRVCPVTGALQYIRHSTIEQIGTYDETFRMGFEDVDYCLRVFEAGLECVYQPAVRAIHHESLFRGQKSDKLNEWHQQSLETLYSKHATTSLGRYVPQIA